jgi:hypothetical protein
MCTVLLPPGVNKIAVKIYQYISIHIPITISTNNSVEKPSFRNRQIMRDFTIINLQYTHIHTLISNVQNLLSKYSNTSYEAYSENRYRFSVKRN